MKRATVRTVCECQAKLGAELDEQCRVLRGWALTRRSGRELVAPAHSMGAGAQRFQIGWACPLCTRNQLRSFDAAGLSFHDGQAAP